MTIEITTDQAPEYFRRLVGDIKKAGERALYLSGLRGVQMIQTQIIPSKVPQPVDRGTYRAGWRVRKSAAGSAVWIENAEAHAVFIEEGVQPGNVKIGRMMIDALAEWAMRKGIADDQAEARGIAFAIANKMKQRGIFNRAGAGNGMHILGELMDVHIEKIMKEEITREVNKAIKDAR